MKDSAVKAMFETIAEGYDFQNSFLSLRRDVYWRKALARSLRPPEAGIILDVAAGTAETSLAISRHHPGVRVVGVDFSPSMLGVGQKKIALHRAGGRISLTAGDGRHMPIRSESVDAVTISFGIRNMEARHLALAEFRRVLKPGGQLCIMEFSYPDSPSLYRLYRFYFDYILPPVGNLISRTDYAYSYLSESVDDFPDDDGFMGEIARVGFTGVTRRKLTFGIAKIFAGCKEGS